MRIKRLFTIGVLLGLGLGPLGALGQSIERIEMRFDTERRVEVVEQDETLRVRAVITHGATTSLRGAWELASPPSTMGEPVFVPLELIQEMLGGADTTELLSPELPTPETGTYLVRLRIDNPRLEKTPKPLRYQVVGN